MFEMTTACNANLVRHMKIGMITLRGDPGSDPFRSAVRSATRLDLPEPNRVALDGGRSVCWMSPDEYLIVLPHDAVPEVLDGLSAALEGEHFLAVDVSDARAVFTLDGADAREVLGKLTPADLSPGVFGARDIRRSRLGQVAAAFWKEEGGAVTVICFRSHADYLERLLQVSIEAGPVGFY